MMVGLILKWAVIKCEDKFPEPTITRIWELGFDRYEDPKAEIEEVLKRVRSVASKRARVWPVRELKRV